MKIKIKKMTEELKNTRKKKWLFKNVTGFKRVLLFSGLNLVLLLILLSVSAEYTSRPSFCPTCHYMETFYQSWRTSKHNNVDCVECHFEPGISGTIKGKLNGLVQIVNYVSLSYKKRTPWAEIPDNTCARSGCHETQMFQDSTYNFKGVEFSHKNHLQEMRRGKTLKCTSCHSQIVQGSHIEVTESTCFTCHFKNSDDPEHKFEKLSDCSTCHKWENTTKQEMSLLRYDHTNVVQKKIDCKNCHANTISGEGLVAKERCYQCHFERDRLEKFDDVKLMHETHITDHSIKCFTCHSSIEHKIVQMDANKPADCTSCHSTAHSSQVNLYTGKNGFNTENSPSSMFLKGINCKGCHVFHEVSDKGVAINRAGKGSCEKCHGKGYDRLTREWENSTRIRLGKIKAIYKNASSLISSSNNINKPVAEGLLSEANHNIKIVEIGKSVHNIEFADKLLSGSYESLQKAMDLIGKKGSLAEFKSSSEFIPNECYSCHLGIEEVSVKKYGKMFSHNQHIVKNKIACSKCHSNVNKHGELIMTENSCNSCHHSKAVEDIQCAKCHKLQDQIYTGNYFNISQPDYMKSGGVKCIDCHLEGRNMIKPDVSSCAKCHDNSYPEMALEWKDDVKKLTADLQNIIAEVRKMNLNSEQKALVNDANKIAKDIASHPSIYAHNYDLISTLLSDRIKELKKLKE